MAARYAALPVTQSPRIAAVVCTYRRPALLPLALASLEAQTLRDAEVLVVDNDPAASARELLAGFPRARYVHEPSPGHSAARNAGMAAARSRLVAFIDDDAQAAPDFLERTLRAFEEVTPRPACVGGRVEPLWGGPRPSWLGDELLGYLSVVDWSGAPGFLGERRWLVGTNLSVDVAALARVGGFSTRLGRRGASLRSNDEIELQRRVRAAGLPIYYDPSIVVRHHVDAERLTRRWLWRRAFWQGISDAIADREERRHGWPSLSVKAAEAGLSACQLAACAARRRPTAAAECRWLAAAGYLVGSVRGM
jgi:GT2 family glycosyltransferase